jgi:SAM-dependent methyltransferase
MTDLSNDFHDQLIIKDGIDQATGFSLIGQERRFEVVRRYFHSVPGRVLDYGCNVGDFYAYIRKHGWSGSYFGVDAKQEFVTRHQERFKKSFNIRVFCGCITNDELYHRLWTFPAFDFVFASGTFCYADQVPKHAEMLRRLWSLTKGTLAVNFLSDLQPPGKRSDKPIHCFYHPHYAFTLAREFNCTSFAVYHDYLPNDWTVILHREPK